MRIKLKSLSKKTWVIFSIAIIALVAGGGYIFKSYSQEPAVTRIMTGIVKKGNVKKVITATGTASLSQVMPLSFEVGGTVKEIYVKEGDGVKEGQPLVQLDTTTLEQALKEANENLASARASYEKTLGDLERKTKSTLVQAEKSLLTAKQNADPYYLENKYHLAELNLKMASDKLANAQSAGETDTYQLQMALSQAQINLLNVKNERDGGAAKELEIAQAEYDSAQKAARDFENRISNEYLTARANLTQSETKLLTAQENLKKATLRAPMDGTIISSGVELYQNVGTSAVISLVADPNDFTVNSSVDQADITEIKIGQKVDMTLDTALDKVIVGTISAVSLKGTNNQNVITYGIKVDVDEPSELLRDQMNVNVAIITEEVKDVLTIPSQALVTRGNMTGVLVPQTDNNEGQTASENSQQRSNSSIDQNSPVQGQRPSNNNRQIPTEARPSSANFGSNTRTSTTTQNGENGASSQFTPIEIGLNDGINVEVKSGLNEGQVIIIQMNLQGTGTSIPLNQNSQRQGGFGGSIPLNGVMRMR